MRILSNSMKKIIAQEKVFLSCNRRMFQGTTGKTNKRKKTQEDVSNKLHSSFYWNMINVTSHKVLPLLFKMEAFYL